MNKNTRWLIGIAMMLLLVSCATVPTSPPAKVRISGTYDKPMPEVWAAVVGIVGMNYPIAVLEKDSGLITTNFVTVANGLMTQRRFPMYVQKPQGPMFAVWDALRMKLSVMVTEIDTGKTQVTIKSHYEAFEKNVMKQWIVCDSNGAVESGIFDAIDQTIESN